MRAGRGIAAGALVAVLALSACGRGGDDAPRLMNLSAQGPDEFAILPSKPLEMPPDIAHLPPPTPGGRNLTDQTPLEDAVVALGGRPGAGGTDAALVGHAARHGVEPGVREVLAAEDLEIRRANRPRLLERLVGTNIYPRAYSRQTVEARPELERWRAAGRRTPAAPPPADAGER